MSGHGLARCVTLLVLLGLAGATALSANTSARPVTDAEAARFQGVGVLYVEGRNVCSVELISATEATTAGHCVYSRRKQLHSPSAGMEVVFGQRDGSRSAVRGVRAVAVLPGFTAPGPRVAIDTMPWDIALLSLDAPVTPDEAQPFRLIDWLEPRGDSVDIIGYEHVMPDHPMIRQGCLVTGSGRGVVVATCKVVGGISGAPVVLSLDPVYPPILVAEVSSRGTAEDGVELAFAVPIARHLAALRAQVDR